MKDNNKTYALGRHIMKDSVIEIVGLDLGDGDTAISKLYVESDAGPERLEIHGKKKQITAIGFESGGEVEIGATALLSKKIKKLFINFKEKPSESNYLQLEGLFRPYITEIYKSLQQSSQIRGNEFTQFTVGCPSEWEQGTLEKTGARELYERMLNIEGIPFLKVISESRAAFVNARDSKKLTFTDLLSTVLIVDIGSSTTDFTMIRSLREQPQDFGENHLGASLIDDIIFKITLLQHENKQHIVRLFDQEPLLKEKCKLACRRAKEELFSQKFYQANPQQEVEVYGARLPEGLFFQPNLTYKFMEEEILKKPQNKLNGQSWEEYFESTLTSVKSDLEKEGSIVDVLILTGGASKMGFTRNICRNVFSAVDISEIKEKPVSQTIFYADSDPEHCIADGLARVGRWDLYASKLKAEVKALITRGEVKEIVQNYIPELVELLAEALSDDIINNVIRLTLKRWQQREIFTFEHAEAYAEDLIAERSGSQEVKDKIEKTCKHWLYSTKILDDLNAKTQPICKKFNIEESGLDLRANIDPDVKSPPIPLEDVLGGERFANLVVGVTDVVSNLLVIGGWVAAILVGFQAWWLLIVGFIFKRNISNVFEGLADQVRQGLNSLLEKVRQWSIERLIKEDIPIRMRNLVLNDEAINTLCKSKMSDLSRELKREMQKEEGNFSNDVTRMVGEAIEDALTERTEQAIILIK